MGGNKIGLRVASVPGPGADGTFTGNIYIDTDTETDVADDNTTATMYDNDGNKANDRDMIIELGQTTAIGVVVLGELVIADNYFTPAGCNQGPGTPTAESPVPCSDDINTVMSVRDDISSDHLVHTVVVTGAAVEATDGADEDADGVITGDTRFNINDDLSITYTGGGLTEGEVIDLRITVNGDTGIANRTTSGVIRVMVTATNSAPVQSDMATTYTIKENDDESITNLVKPNVDSAVVEDLSGLFTDPEGGAITYRVAGDGDVGTSSTYFDFDGSELIVKTAIPNAKDAVPDDAATTEVDESKPAEPPPGSTCRDITAGDGCGNLQFVFKIAASDGVTSNDQEVEITVIVDVNDKVVLTDAISE